VLRDIVRSVARSQLSQEFQAHYERKPKKITIYTNFRVKGKALKHGSVKPERRKIKLPYHPDAMSFPSLLNSSERETRSTSHGRKDNEPLTQ